MNEEKTPDCAECDDTGQVTCWNCGGTGMEPLEGEPDEYESELECIECIGDGWLDCDECDA